MALDVTWRSPSNIALIKYWGKHGIQLPRNPSLSLTLSECYTQMRLTVEPVREGGKLEVLYDGVPRPAFGSKILSLFKLVSDRYNWLTTSNIVIDSFNTFPHGAGIASSASAMSALALCIEDIDLQLRGSTDSIELNRVSETARLGSGSACRSIFPSMALWGADENINGSSDLYAIPWESQIDPFYKDYCDSILIIHDGEKSVSSTAGHELMNSLPFADIRYDVARKNLHTLIEVLKVKDRVEEFNRLCEYEAMQLHALMMSGESPYILMAPNTISAIQKIWQYRIESGNPVCFTLDAGPNVHVLYPQSHASVIREWLENELTPFCVEGRMIHDRVGAGPLKIN